MLAPIKIDRIHDVVLKVRPIFIDIAHELAYEGPCRFGKGQELEPEFDHMINNEAYKGFLMGLKYNMPEGVEILEPHRLQGHTDGWCISEEEMKKLCQGADETDFYFVSTTGRTGEMIVEFAQMVKKPIAFIGNDFGMTINTSAMLARGIECYAFMNWDEVRLQMRVLRTKKALAETRVLCVTRFNGNLSLQSANDSFIDLEKVHQVTGAKFRFANLHEVLDQLEEIDPTTNHTLPGRTMDNINAEDRKEIERITDELIAGAAECDMDREDVLRSVKGYYLIQKLLHKNECNAFTMPCPDTCSTCRINKEKLTFCLTHSLDNESGIPSCCEYDIAAVLSKSVLQTLANKPSYMGNTAVLTTPDGKLIDDGCMMHFSKDHIGPDKWAALDGMPNMIMTGHSVPNRRMKGFDAELAPYALRSFAYSGFGATMRLDFDQDAGQVVTMCRFDPNCEKLLISKGVLKGGFGYKMQNCTLGALIQVEDADKFFRMQIQVGNHVPFVYGDYVNELIALAQSLGLEALVC